MKLKYFNETILSLINQIKNQVDLPSDFTDFFKFNNGELCIISLKPEEVKSICLGIEIEDEIYMFDGTLNAEEIKNEIKFNLQSTGVLKFANNSINEGGFYIGVNNSNRGKIYFYENYVEWAKDEEIILLSNSFKEFIENLKPVGLIFTESNIEYKFLDEELDSKGNLLRLKIQ